MINEKEPFTEKVISKNENDQIIIEMYFKNGKREGTQKLYFDNGSIRAKEDYEDGLLDGSQKYYFDNGCIKSEKNYKNGKLVIDYKSY